MAPDETTPTPAESNEQKPMSYTETINHLSGMEFETSTIIDSVLPPNISIAIQTTSAIFKKDVSEVLSDLIDKRHEEAEDVRIDDELRYGHLGQYDR